MQLPEVLQLAAVMAGRTEPALNDGATAEFLRLQRLRLRLRLCGWSLTGVTCRPEDPA